MLRFPRMIHLLAGSLPLALGACMNFPDTRPHQAEVLQAAREVIAERYPMSSASQSAGYVIAQGPVTMDGTWKTKKQISVVLVRNYTGAHEPVVRVWKLVESGEPAIANNPEAPGTSYTITAAQPFAVNEWTPLVNLPFEEQEIYDAILAKLAAPEADTATSPVVATPPPGA